MQKILFSEEQFALVARLCCFKFLAGRIGLGTLFFFVNFAISTKEKMYRPLFPFRLENSSSFSNMPSIRSGCALEPVLHHCEHVIRLLLLLVRFGIDGIYARRLRSSADGVRTMKTRVDFHSFLDIFFIVTS